METITAVVGSLHRLVAGRYLLSQLVLEIGDGFAQPGAELNFGLPPAQLAGTTDVGLPPFGVILGERRIDDLASASGEPNDLGSQVENGQFLRIPEVDR